MAPILEVPVLVIGLLLKKPETPATKIAAPAIVTVRPRFTCSPLFDLCSSSQLRTVSTIHGVNTTEQKNSAKNSYW